MSKKEITLTYYQIKSMGIYDSEGKVLLTPSSLMKELKAWGYDEKKPLIETATYERNSKHLESYCLDFYESDGDYIIGLWNRLETGQKGIGSISASSTSEDAVVEHTKLKKDSIPGYPSYFFISPSQNILATIKLDNHVLGISQFRSYIKGFISRHSSHVVRRKEGDETIFGLSKYPKPNEGNDERFPDNKVRRLFHMLILKKDMEEEFLLSNAMSITKIIKDISTEILTQDKNETSIEQLVRFIKDIPITKKKSTRVSIPVTLNYKHVEDLIKDYRESDGSTEYNAGFVLRGDSQKIHWLDGTVLTGSAEANIEMQSLDRPNLQSLMALIKSSKLDKVTIQSEQKESVA